VSKDGLAGGHHGGRVPVLRHHQEAVAPGRQDPLQQGLRRVNGLALARNVLAASGGVNVFVHVHVHVSVELFHVPPVDLVEDQDVGVRLANGANHSGRDGLQVAFVPG